MSSTTSLVKELLDQKSTLKGRRTGGGTGDDSRAVTKSDVEQAVREGVSDALAEHERTYHEEAVDEPTDDDDDLEEDQSSGGGSSKKGLLLLIVIVAYLVRRRRSQDGSDDY